MTSKVVIDAHAGWPIEVVFEEKLADGEWQQNSAAVVKPHTEATFYIHDSKRIVRVQEMKKEE